MRSLKELRDKIAAKAQKPYINRMLKSKANQAFWDALDNPATVQEHVLKEKVFQNNPEISEKSYASAKTRFKNTLLSALFFPDLDKSKFSQYYIDYFKCNQHLFWGKFLLKLGVGNLGVEMLKDAVKYAEKTNATIEHVNSLMLLCSRYAINGEKAKFRETSQKLDQMQDILTTENKLNAIYLTIILDFTAKAGIIKDPQDISKYKQIDNKVQYLAKVAQNFRILYAYFHIRTMILEATGKFKPAIRECDNAINRLSEWQEDFGNMLQGHFELRKLNCYLSLRMHSKAQKTSKLVTQLYRPNSINYLRSRIYHVLIPLHTGDYRQAWLQYNEIFDKDLKSRSLPNVEIEKWRIIAGYIALGLMYLKKSGDKITHSMEKFSEGTNPGTLPNECPELTKDKAGWNVSIKVLEIMFQVLNDRNTELIGQYDSLRSYIQRNLSNNAPERILIFVNFLKTSINITDKETYERAYLKAVEKIKKIPPVMSDNEAMQEIILLENLLQMHRSCQMQKSVQ